MLKLVQSVCLTGTGLLAIGAFLSAGSSPSSSQTRTPQRLVETKSPLVVAMQESETKIEKPRGDATTDRGWIGVMLEDNKGQGSRIIDVFPAGPAAFAGVRVGDVLVRVGDTVVDSHAAATAAIEGVAPGKQTSLTIERRGKTLELKVKVESLAEFRAHYVTEMMRRDPRSHTYARHHGVSEADMSAELVRRLFEQHERLERSLHEVLKEVRELRQEVRALKK